MDNKNDNVNRISIGVEFQKETARNWKDITKVVLKDFSLKKKVDKTKRYAGAEIVSLPKPDYVGMPLEEAIVKRRSIRKFSNTPVDVSELSQVLFSAGGTNGKLGKYSVRTVPSAGLKYPIELYVLINDVNKLNPGIYHYNSEDHCLELVKSGKHSKKLENISFKQGKFDKFSAVIFISAVFERTYEKYGDRGYRFIYMEAGHTSQNIYLQSTSLGLGTCCYGEFNDVLVNEFLDLDPDSESVLYIHSLGRLL